MPTPVPSPPAADPPEITADLVRRLVAEQLPHLAGRAVTPVPRQGWDNRTFRLGDDLTVRLPSAAGYVAAVEKEDRALPLMAAHLPVPVPVPVATGRPSAAFPFPWSVRRWIDGEPLDHARDVDRDGLARDLAAFLVALRAVPAADGPVAGRHSFFRGCHPGVYGDEVAEALVRLGPRVDAAACRAVWQDAVTTAWPGPPVWFHGDVAAGNLLVAGGRLAAVIDLGTCGVGDPACDLVVAWTFFDAPERRELRDAVGLDAATWRRARGWALWKALVTVAGMSGSDRDGGQSRALAAVLADPVVGGTVVGRPAG